MAIGRYRRSRLYEQCPGNGNGACVVHAMIGVKAAPGRGALLVPAAGAPVAYVRPDAPTKDRLVMSMRLPVCRGAAAFVIVLAGAHLAAAQTTPAPLAPPECGFYEGVRVLEADRVQALLADPGLPAATRENIQDEPPGCEVAVLLRRDFTQDDVPDSVVTLGTPNGYESFVVDGATGRPISPVIVTGGHTTGSWRFNPATNILTHRRRYVGSSKKPEYIAWFVKTTRWASEGVSGRMMIVDETTTNDAKEAVCTPDSPVPYSVGGLRGVTPEKACRLAAGMIAHAPMFSTCDTRMRLTRRTMYGWRLTLTGGVTMTRGRARLTVYGQDFPCSI